MKNIISAKIRPVGEINISSELLNKLLVEPKSQPPIFIKPELLSPKNKFWLAFYSKASSIVTNEKFDLLSLLIRDHSKFEEIVKKAEAKFYFHFENNLNAFSASWSKSLQEKIYDKIHIRIISLSYNSLDIVFGIEPMDKILTFFDNNYSFFEHFIVDYIEDSIYTAYNYADNSIGLNRGNFPLETAVNYSLEGLTSTGNNFVPNNIIAQPNAIIQQPITVQPSNSVAQSNNISDNRRNLARFIGSPFVLPLLVSLGVLYFAYFQINNTNKSLQEQNKFIQDQKDKVIESYKELLEEAKKINTLESEVIPSPKKSTIERSKKINLMRQGKRPAGLALKS